jgi:hypothetical protein
MSRGYPRFLYSNPQNTADKGPFIISTIEPHVICKFHPGRKDQIDLDPGKPCVSYGNFSLELLRPVMLFPEKEYSNIVEQIVNSMAKWLKAQIREGEIKI